MRDRVGLRTDSRPTASRPVGSRCGQRRHPNMRPVRACAPSPLYVDVTLHGALFEDLTLHVPSSRAEPLPLVSLPECASFKLLHTHMNPRADCPPGRPSHLMRRQPHMLQRYAYVRVRGREFAQNTTSQNLTQRHGCRAPMTTLSASEPMT